jgi:hypothetical protein
MVRNCHEVSFSNISKNSEAFILFTFKKQEHFHFSHFLKSHLLVLATWLRVQVSKVNAV